MEANERLALEHLVNVSAEVEVRLTAKGLDPLKDVLARARDEAAQAMIGLTQVIPTDASAITALQNIVIRYVDMVGWLKVIVDEGKVAGRRLDEERDEELRDLIVGNEEMAEVIGLRTGAPTE